MLKERATLIANVLRMVDFLSIFSSFLVAYYIRFQHLDFLGESLQIFNAEEYALTQGNTSYSIFQPGFHYLVLLALCIIIWYISLNGFGCYRSMRLISIKDTIRELLKAHGTASFCLLAILFFQKGEAFSRIFIVLFLSILGTLLIIQKTGLKIILMEARKRGLNFRNVLIVGVGRSATRITKLIEDHPDIGWSIVVISGVPRRTILLK
jgi:FlaA1/EpsC-like NDP-sugar epimerase